LLALEAMGRIESIEAFQTSGESTFEPNMSRHQRYQEGIERQARVYDRLFAHDGGQ
jgi:hypothetical protein